MWEAGGACGLAAVPWGRAERVKRLSSDLKAWVQGCGAARAGQGEASLAPGLVRGAGGPGGRCRWPLEGDCDQNGGSVALSVPCV